MATHHSKTSRAKSPNAQIVVPSWDKVWDSFKEKREKTTIESMEADGWKLAIQVAKDIGLSRQALFDLIYSEKIDSTKAKIKYSGKTREMVFVRPKI